MLILAARMLDDDASQQSQRPGGLWRHDLTWERNGSDLIQLLARLTPPVQLTAPYRKMAL
jgi:hypothetical protein